MYSVMCNLVVKLHLFFVVGTGVLLLQWNTVPAEGPYKLGGYVFTCLVRGYSNIGSASDAGL